MALKKYYPLIVIISLAPILQIPIWLGYTDFYSGKASDLIPYIYGTKQLMYDTFQNLREIPLWNPYFMFGQPIVGNVQYNIFYPLNILFLLFPFHTALWIHQIVHMIIAGIGTYMLSKHTGLSREASLISSCLYMFNGRLLYYINAGWLHLFSSLCWIPLLLLTSLLLIERKGRLYSIGLAIVFFMIFTSGNPQHAFLFCFLFIFQAIWSIIKTKSKDERLSLLYRILLSALISFLLISIQLFPAIEQAYLSSRVFVDGSLHGFYFNWDVGQWLRILFRPEILPHDHAWELCAYIGIGGMLLAFYGFSSLRNRLFLIVIWGGIPFLVSLGPAFPPTAMVLAAIPGMDILSSPSRYFIFTILILSVLSGHGFEKLIESFGHNPKRAFLLILLLCIALAITALLIPPFDTVCFSTTVRFFGALIIFLISAAIYFWRRTKLFKILLICWIIADPLLLSTEILKEKYKPEDFKLPDKVISALTQFPSPVRVATIQPEELRESRLNPFDDWISVKYGIPRAGGVEPLAMLNTYNFLTQMDGTGEIKGIIRAFRLWGFARPDLYNIAGITHLISVKPIENPHLKFIVQDSITMPHFHGGRWRGEKIYLYENIDALPRAFFLADRQRNLTKPVSINIISPNRIQLRVDTDQAGRLIVSESFHPGWNATSEGKSFKVEPFLNAFISIQVLPGSHEILLNFFPQSFRVGLWLTLAGLLFVIISFFYEKIRPEFFQVRKK